MQLIRYEAARTALAECQAVDEVKDIRDKALAMEAYARQAKDTNLMQMAAEIKVRAERRLGEMLREQKETVGLNPGGRPAETPRDERGVSLADIGISYDLSSRSQQLAAMPAEHFETAIASAKETAKAVSTTYMLRLSEEARKTEALRADINRMQRDNAFKRVIAAFDDAVFWLEAAAADKTEPKGDQAEKLYSGLDAITRLVAQTIGETHEHH